MNKIKFWVQKVLPLVYDDSLSYYELLCKVVAKLNEIIPLVNDLQGVITEQVKEYLDELISDGTLKDIIDNELLSDLNTRVTEIENNYASLSDDLDNVKDTQNEHTSDINSLLKLIEDGVVPNNKVGIHLVEPVKLFNATYCVDGGRVNGFCADDDYFYMASAIDDDVTRIAKINRTTGDYEFILPSLTGIHPNSMSIYGDVLYIVDSNTGCVYKLNKDTLDSEGTFYFDPNANAISVHYINEYDNVYTGALETSNNNVSIYYKGSDGLSRLMSRIPINVFANCYSQGLEITYNCIYVSRSFGRSFNDWGHYSLITAYGYNGFELNTVFVDLEEEVEDIYRDSDNDRLYFASGDGYIYYYDTSLFTRSENYHQLGATSLRDLNGWQAVIGDNADVILQGTSENGLMRTLKLSPQVTAYQGQWIGYGLIGGISAFFFSRRREIIGTTMWFPSGSTDKTMMIGTAQYYFGDDNNIGYTSGMVMLKDGTWETLEQYHADTPTVKTVINSLVHIPYTVPYDRSGLNI